MLHRIYDDMEPDTMSPAEERVLEARDAGFEKGYNQAMQEIDNKQEQLMEKQTKNIFQRMVQVMGEVDYVPKESKKVNGQYTYASHDAVKKALHHPMVKAGIYMKSTILEMTQDGNRTDVKMEITFYNIDNPEDRIIVEYRGYGIDSQDKGVGKAISYATKYALLNAFCLETGDDAERDLIEHKPEAPKPECISKEQVKLINGLGEQNPDQLEKILKALKGEGVNRVEEIPAGIYPRIVKALQKPILVTA